MPRRLTFGKDEKLCSKRIIDDLFSGNAAVSFHKFPLKFIITIIPLPAAVPCQAVFVVPKKSFKKAHDRNLLRRRMREAYRLSKSAMYDCLAGKQKQMAVAVIYTQKTLEDFSVIQKATDFCLAKIISHLHENS